MQHKHYDKTSQILDNIIPKLLGKHINIYKLICLDLIAKMQKIDKTDR